VECVGNTLVVKSQRGKNNLTDVVSIKAAQIGYGKIFCELPPQRRILEITGKQLREYA
jgi:hypothetical protein